LRSNHIVSPAYAPKRHLSRDWGAGNSMEHCPSQHSNAAFKNYKNIL
jgi:hypothetical protein